MNNITVHCECSSDWGTWISLFVAIVTCGVMIYQCINARNLEKEKRVNDLSRRLEHIIELTLAYPYLEHPSVTQQWNEKKGSNEEKFMRYDQFCDIIFNYLWDVYTFYNGDKKKIETFVNVKHWVRIHRQIWENPSTPYENADSYSAEFRNYIESHLK